MGGVTTASLGELRTAIEDIYRCSDELLSTLSEQEWARKHGKDWTMADVPFHLAYFDRILVADCIERGDSVPADEQVLLPTRRAIDDWNARLFAARPPTQTAAESVAELREVRERVRALMSGLTDADLERRAWAPLAGLGWRTVRTALVGAVMHNWSEHVQLLLRLGRRSPLPSTESTHLALDGFMHFFPMGVNREQAAKTPVTARMAITGPGGGQWLIRAGATGCDVAEDDVSPAQLTMTMSPETWTRMWNNMSNPMLLMLSRRIKLKGLRNMGRFGKVFAPPKPDTPMAADLVHV